MHTQSNAQDVAGPVISKDTSVGDASGSNTIGPQANENTGTEITENATIPKEQDLQRTMEQFMVLLQKLAPALFTIELYNSKFLKDMEYGEIHIVQYVREGRIFKIDGYPRISRMVDNG